MSPFPIPVEWAEPLAWTLIHFLWQGVALAAAGLAWLLVSRWRGAEARYACWMAVLTLMVLAPLVTFGISVSTMAERRGETARLEISKETTDGEIEKQSPHELLGALSKFDPATARELAGLLMAASTPDDVAQVPPVSSNASAGSVDIVFAGRTWSQWLTLAWLVGICLASLRLGVAGLGIWRIHSRLVPATEAMTLLMHDLARRLDLMAPPRIAFSPDVPEPLVLLWLRPVILWPASWAAGVSPTVLEAVLAHELAHIRRHDLWVNLGQRLVETVFFFHPCVWWVSKQIRIERELCCDALAVQVTGQPLEYAQALEMVAQRRWAFRSPAEGFEAQLAIGMGGNRMALLHRVKRVLGVESSTAGSHWWGLGLAVCSLSLMGWMGSTLWSAPEDERRRGEDDSAYTEEDDRPRPPRPHERPRPKHEEDRERDRDWDREYNRDRGHDRGPQRERHPLPPPHRHEGPHARAEHRPPHALMRELIHSLRELENRGEEGRRQKEEILRHLLAVLEEDAPPPPGGPAGRGPDSRRPEPRHPEPRHHEEHGPGPRHADDHPHGDPGPGHRHPEVRRHEEDRPGPRHPEGRGPEPRHPEPRHPEDRGPGPRHPEAGPRGEGRPEHRRGEDHPPRHVDRDIARRGPDRERDSRPAPPPHPPAEMQELRHVLQSLRGEIEHLRAEVRVIREHQTAIPQLRPGMIMPVPPQLRPDGPRLAPGAPGIVRPPVRDEFRPRPPLGRPFVPGEKPTPNHEDDRKEGDKPSRPDKVKEPVKEEPKAKSEDKPKEEPKGDKSASVVQSGAEPVKSVEELRTAIEAAISAVVTPDAAVSETTAEPPADDPVSAESAKP